MVSINSQDYDDSETQLTLGLLVAVVDYGDDEYNGEVVDNNVDENA